MNSFVGSFKNIFKWRISKSLKSPKINNDKQESLLLAGFIGIFEDVLFWRNIWLSSWFIFMINVIFFVCAHQQINFLGFLFSFGATIVCIDAIEAWLKYKHRTSCLKRLAGYNGSKLCSATIVFNKWLRRKWTEFVFLRETNHTKAFILMNLIFGTIFAIGNYINGYISAYVLCMFLCVSKKVLYPIMRLLRNIQEDIESEHEFEGLLPEVSEVNINLLSIEPEQRESIDEKQSLDYWRPEDVPLEEASNSSDSSDSLDRNLYMEKHTLEQEVVTSDSSEDEYIPLMQQKEQLQSTLEVAEPSNTWSNSAYNAFWNLTGAVTNLMNTDLSKNKRKRVSSNNSSDDFEMIDNHDIN